MFKRVGIITLILLSLTLNAADAVVERFTIDEAVNMALKNNLALQAKRKELNILEQEAKIATQLKNPQAQSNVLLGSVSKVGNSSQAGLAFPIEIAKRGARKNVVLAQYDIVQNEVLAQEHVIRIEVMRAYFDVLYQKSLYYIMKEREETFKNMYDIAASRPENSSNYKIDLLQSDIRHKKQLVILNKTKSNLLNAQFRLNEIMNLKDASKMFDTQELNVLGDLAVLNIKVPEYSVVEDIALRYSYNLMIAEDSINKAKKDLVVARHKVIPDAVVAGGYAFNRDIGGAFVGGALDIPILNTYRADVKKAKIAIDKSKLDRDSFEAKMKMLLKQHYNQFKYSKENIEHYKDIVKDSSEILKMSTQRYKEGKTGYHNLVMIENQHQDTLMEYISAIQIYYNSYLDLMYHMGHDELLEDNL